MSSLCDKRLRAFMIRTIEASIEFLRSSSTVDGAAPSYLLSERSGETSFKAISGTLTRLNLDVNSAFVVKLSSGSKPYQPVKLINESFDIFM
jgi:hypothetical protein